MRLFFQIGRMSRSDGAGIPSGCDATGHSPRGITRTRGFNPGLKAVKPSAWFLAAVLLTGCDSKPSESPAPSRPTGGRPVVYTVSHPLQYFAQRIGGDAVDVVFPAPAEVDPADWMPDRDAIKAYQSADLILLNGANYAKWLDKVSLPEAKLTDTSAPFRAQLLKVQDVVTHSHGKGGEHSHTGTASHTWLNPRLAAMQAEAVRDALARLVPAQKDEFEANLIALKQDLLTLDAELEAILKPHRDRPVLFSHPIYQYFQQRFALHSRNLHWEPDEFPDEAAWKAFEDLRKESSFDLVIWEGTPSEKTVAELRKRGVRITVFTPCANIPAQGDFLTVMRENTARLKAAFGSGVE